MRAKADLHMHTTFSDGALSPQELLEQASRAGLTIVSITDHDNVGAFDDAIPLGKRMGIEVIPGVELSASIEDRDIHILGYFIDYTSARFREFIAVFRAERVKRAERIVEKLNGLNVPLRIEAVMDLAGPGSVGRPHIANALVEEGLASTYHDAFNKYIGTGKPAYEKKFHISPREAIELISSAGGLSFVAHPGNNIDEDILTRLIRDGVDGIEVVHPSHSPERVSYYSGIVSEYFLLASGGSDFHGGRRNDHDALGKWVIPEEYVAMMRRRL